MFQNRRLRSLVDRLLSFEMCEPRHLLAGDVSFAEPIIYAVSPALLSDLEVGDVNGDGSFDVLTSSFHCCGKPRLLLGNGDGTFTLPRIDLGLVVDGRLADLNNDGHLDVVSTSRTQEPKGIDVILNQGSDGEEWLGFAPLQRFPIMDTIVPQGFGIGHFDQDEYLDIAVADNTVVWTSFNEGQSDGQWDGFLDFESLEFFGNARFPDKVIPGDLDDNGDLDLVVGNYRGGDVSVFLGNGDGTFDKLGSLAVGETTSSVGLGDLDGDGYLDMVATVFLEEEVAVYKGNGDGTFELPERYSTGVSIRNLTMGDLDADGDLDIANLSYNSDEVPLLINQGDGTFVKGDVLQLGPNGPRAATTADLDGDGDQDLIVATGARSNAAVNVLLNNANFNIADAEIGVHTLEHPSLGRDGVASQSSTRRQNARFGPSNANDGDPQTRSQTEADGDEHHWQAELSQSEPIERIVVVVRGTSQASLDGEGLVVQVLDEQGNEVWRSEHTEAIDDQIVIDFADRDISGQTIRVIKPSPMGTALLLNEVEVYGREVDLAQRVLTFDLNAEDQTSDLLRFEGNLLISVATLRANLVAGTPAAGMQFKLLDAFETSGSFDQLILPELPPDLEWDASQLGSQGLLIVRDSRPVGDNNGDGVVNSIDIDALYKAIAEGNDDPQLDLNMDGEVTDQDVEFLIQEIIMTVHGDVNLDTKVDFSDFLVVSSNFGQMDASWSDGDLDGDGEVSFGDFLLLSDNFGFGIEI